MAKQPVNKIHVPMNKRPKCATKGCTKIVQHLGTYDVDGYPRFRKYCIDCHNSRRENFRNLVENFDRRKAPKCSARNCTKRVSAFGTNNKGELKFNIYCDDHTGFDIAHLAHRKDYCENTDGRLGFVCTTTIYWEGMLDVDHIDGDPHNQDPKNYQTLCKCCHAYKTNKNRDYSTPGRKALKKRGLFTKLVG